MKLKCVLCVYWYVCLTVRTRHGKSNIKHVSHFTATSTCAEPSRRFGQQDTFDKQIFGNGRKQTTQTRLNVISKYKQRPLIYVLFTTLIYNKSHQRYLAAYSYITGNLHPVSAPLGQSANCRLALILVVIIVGLRSAVCKSYNKR